VIGTSCSGNQNGADWDTIFQCVSGTFQRASPFLAGSVGIGTTVPELILEAHGTGGAPAISGATQTGVMRMSLASPNNVLDFGGYTGSPYGMWMQATNSTSLGATYPIVINPNGGYVGIGTAVPLGLLHLFQGASGVAAANEPASNANAIDIESNTNAGISLLVPNADNANIFFNSAQSSSTVDAYIQYLGANRALRFGVNGAATEAMRITSNGSVGIGTTGPNYLLHVGSTSASGAVAGFQNSADLCTLTPAASTPTWSCSSDIRLKTDIADTGDALAQLDNMRVRDFTMKATGERQTGVIAQELQTAHPDMVHLGPNGFYTVDSPNPWQLVKAIQELGTENDNLRTKLKAANDNEAAQIGALTVRLNALESRRR
jgi:hypothetical protein